VAGGDWYSPETGGQGGRQAAVSACTRNRNRNCIRPVKFTMATVLDLESLACTESALHGLGHWHRAYPERVEGLIDGFLARRRESR
jgi:hypothetical protein